MWLLGLVIDLFYLRKGGRQRRGGPVANRLLPRESCVDDVLTEEVAEDVPLDAVPAAHGVPADETVVAASVGRCTGGLEEAQVEDGQGVVRYLTFEAPHRGLVHA